MNCSCWVSTTVGFICGAFMFFVTAVCVTLRANRRKGRGDCDMKNHRRSLWRRVLILPKVWLAHYRLFRKHHGKCFSAWHALSFSKFILVSGSPGEMSADELTFIKERH